MTRRPSQDLVKVASVGMSYRGAATPERRVLRFTVSEDVMRKLFRMHDKQYRSFLVAADGDTKGLPERWRQHRVVFHRLKDMGLPAVFVQIEPPTFNPVGGRIWQASSKKNRQYNFQIMARKVRVKDGITSKVLEHMWSEELHGLLLMFPDDDMVLPEPQKPKRVRKYISRAERRLRRGAPIPVDPDNMKVT